MPANRRGTYRIVGTAGSGAWSRLGIGSKEAARRAAKRAAEKVKAAHASPQASKVAKTPRPKVARAKPIEPDVIKGLVRSPTQRALPQGKWKPGGRSLKQPGSPGMDGLL